MKLPGGGGGESGLEEASKRRDGSGVWEGRQEATEERAGDWKGEGRQKDGMVRGPQEKASP